MGHQIVKQPNGLYALWSSIVDTFILLDATPEDIIQDWNVRDEKQNRAAADRIIAQLERGEAPYYQFTKSWDACIRWITQQGEHLDTLEIVDNLLSKEEAQGRLQRQAKNKCYDLWLHVPTGRAIPEKPKDAKEGEWRRITAWTSVEENKNE